MKENMRKLLDAKGTSSCHLVLVSALILFASYAARAAEPSRPNIVFILADDWGWGDLSCHGNTWLKTPHLDKFASEGIDFQQFNVLNPVCSPSRTAFTTGMYPARFSVHQHFSTAEGNAKRNMPDWLDPKAPTLAHFLKTAGYTTGHFGKWHLSTQIKDAPLPSLYGFDEFKVFNGPGEEDAQAGIHDTSTNAIRFIRDHKDVPFYLDVWIHESHTRHDPSKESMEKWKNLDEQRQVYAAVITDGDNAVGQVLDALKEAGLADNTIVIFSADNGPEQTGPESSKNTDNNWYYSVGTTGGLRGRKRSLFEGGVRPPFIVRWPGHAPAGVKNEKTVMTGVDLLPTLCAAAGVKLPDDYKGDGENLLDAFNGKAAIRTRPIFWEWRGPKTQITGGSDKSPNYWPRLAVREDDWKLVLTDDEKRMELYNLADNRAEDKDCAKEHPEIVKRLSRMALDWKATLPETLNPDCISKLPPAKKGKAAKSKNENNE